MKIRQLCMYVSLTGMLTGVANATVLAEYDADAGSPIENPTVQGWAESGLGTGSIGEAIVDGGTNAWRILDDSSSHRPRYEVFLAAPDFLDMYANGWTFEFTVRAVTGSQFCAWGMTDGNDPGWGLTTRERVGFTVAYDGGAFKVTPIHGGSITLGAGSADDFHTIRCVGIPLSPEYEFFVDDASYGFFDIRDGSSNSSHDNRAIFHSGSTGGTGLEAYWHFVSLTVPDSVVSVLPDGGTTEVDEEGPTSDIFTFVLNEQPTATVTVAITPDGGPAAAENIDLGSGPGVAVQREFDSGNWGMAQTVTVTAVDDTYQEGTHMVVVRNTLTSDDPDFDGVLRSIPVTVLDNDLAEKQINFFSQPFISPKGPYVTNEDAYHTFRIPGMVVADDGSVLVFAEGRRGDGSDPRRDDNAPMDMCMRRSTDGGTTWDPLVVLDPGFKASGAKVDFGDPTPVLDETTGGVILMYGQWPDYGSITANWGQDPDSTNGNHVLYVQTSSDDGVTWSGPVQIDYPDEPGETADGLYWRVTEPGPGSGIQLRWQTNTSLNGRLVIPAKRKGSVTVDGSANSKGHVFYSDDHGATWLVGNVASAGGNENEVVERISGQLLLDARAAPRTRFTSDDGGDTWADAPSSDIPVTTVDTSLIRFSADRDGHDRDRLLFSGPGGNPVGSGSGRYNQLVWTSYDEGQTFINPVQFVFDGEQSAYSVLAKLQDDSIGMLVETSGDEPFNQGQSYGDITYFNFDIDCLEGFVHPAALRHYDSFGNPIDRKRGGVGFSGSWSGDADFTDAVAPELNGVNIHFDGFGYPPEFGRVDLVEGQSAWRTLSENTDLNTNGATYISMLVSAALDTSADGASDESLDIAIQDTQGVAHVSFGIASDESFYVGEPGDAVTTAPDSFLTDGSYFLVAKVASQDDASGGNFDQIFLKAFRSGADTIPDSEDAIAWTLVGTTGDNHDAKLDRVAVSGGNNATFSVDELRIGRTYASVVSHIPALSPTLRGIGPVMPGAEIAVSWTGQVAHTYGVETNADLATKDWGLLTNGLPGSGELISITNSADANEGFYRVIVE